MSQPSASRIISTLESSIGTRLFVRTTRAVTLTETGADYLARIDPILAALEEADYAARGTGELRGLLRIALSSSFGTRELIPKLPVFLSRHPRLRLDLRIDDSRQDLVEDGIDIAFRLGNLSDMTATARKIGSAPRIVAASPVYLAARGTPQTPADLARHDVIVGPGGGGANAWTFSQQGRRVSAIVEGRVLAGANEGAVAAAVAGLGIMSGSLWSCRAELAAGTLVRVLGDWPRDIVDLHAVFPGGRAASPAARALADYAANQFRAMT